MMATHAQTQDPARKAAQRRSTRRTGLFLVALALFFMISVGITRLWGKL
jgi:hypothetical protein